MTEGVPKSPNNVTSTFFNTVHVLPKDLSFEHGGAKLFLPTVRHLISLLVSIFFSTILLNILQVQVL